MTPSDLQELERIFLEAGLADEDDLSTLNADGGLGLFIRSLVGLDRSAAKQAIAGFMSGRSLRADQIEFLDVVVEHLTQQGMLEPERLYESPFTDQHEQGVSGLFDDAEITTLFDLLQTIKARAAA